MVYWYLRGQDLNKPRLVESQAYCTCVPSRNGEGGAMGSGSVIGLLTVVQVDDPVRLRCRRTRVVSEMVVQIACCVVHIARELYLQVCTSYQVPRRYILGLIWSWL